MKVIRLNEVLNKIIADAKENYDNAQSPDEKLQVLNSFLIDNKVLKNDIKDKLLSYGYPFIDRWLEAMRWEELGRDGNEFVYILNHTRPESITVSNTGNFGKIYNAYAEGSIVNEYLNDELFREKLLENPDIYSLSNDEFKQVFKVYDTLRSRGLDDEDIAYVFLEDPENPQVSDISSIADILAKSGMGSRDKSRKSNIDINNMSNEDAIEMIRTLFQKNGLNQREVLNSLNSLMSN